MSIYLGLFWLSLALVGVAAARWGGVPERSAAAMYVVAALATVLVRPAFATRYQAVEPTVFLIDLILLVGLVTLTIRHDRWWPICATALQALAVLAHVGKLMNPDLWRFGYQLMAVWSAWPTVLILAAGVWSNRRRTWMRRENT